MCFYSVIFNLSYFAQSDYYSTLNNEEISTVESCMLQKHPCDPNTLDCSNALFNAANSLQATVMDMMTMFDANYSPLKPYKSFPGVETGLLRLRASSCYSTSEYPDFAQMDFKRDGCCTGWRAASNSQSEYLLFGTPVPYTFTKIQTKGKNSTDWVSSYKLKYSLDGVNWVSYNNDEELIGNVDGFYIVEKILKPFVARVLKLVPLTWSGNIATKAEVFLSNFTYKPLLPPGSLIAGIVCGFNIDFSSIYNENYNYNRVILDFISAGSSGWGWCNRVGDSNIWALVSSVVPMTWNKITFQADSNDWITSFVLYYTIDRVNWVSYDNGNQISISLTSLGKVNVTLTPFNAVSIKIYPKSCYNYCCSRFEFYCSEVIF